MGMLLPPRLAVDIAWPTNPQVALTDETVAWVDTTAYLELDHGVSIARRRSDELDESSPGTATATFNNADSRFTQLNVSSPYWPYVKYNRLIRYRSTYPDSVNALWMQPATGGADLGTAAGMSAPSGTVTSLLSTATASAAGTTTTLKCLDADATDIEIGDVIRLFTAGGALKESTFFKVTGESSSAGTTTFTFSPAATLSTATTDVAKARRYQWATGLQPTAGTRLANGDTGTLLAGPDAIPVTAGLPYTWSAYASRTGTVPGAPVALTGVNDVTTATVTASATLVGNKPSATADGDLLVATLCHRNSAGTWDVVPAGWTLAAGQSTSGTTAIYVKPIPSAAAEVATSYSWHTTGGSARGQIVISRVTGADLTTPVDAAGSAVVSGTSSIVDPAVTAVSSTGLLYGMFASFLGTAVQPVITAPGSMTSVAGVPVTTGAATAYLLVAAETLSASGTTGTRTASVSPAGTAAAGQMITIAPAAASGAISASPRILWYDLAGAQLSETTGSVTALTTALQRLSVTGTAPVNAVLARVAVANETVFPGTPSIAFRAIGTGLNGGRSATGVLAIPATVAAGDGMLLFVNMADSSLTCSTPAGWTAVANRTGGNCRTYLFKCVATSSGAETSAGKYVSITTSGRVGTTYTLVAYSGTDTADAVHQSNSVAETTIQATHTTPNVTTSVANCWIVSAAFDRSSTTSLWTKPVGDLDRGGVYLTGSGAPTGDVTDNAAPVAAGTYGSKVFTANTSSGEATMWTVALKPNTSSGGTGGTMQVTGGQFEQAAAASAWASPGITYIHFVGHAAGFPTSWEGGVRALCEITATDRQKQLDGAPLRGAIAEQTLTGTPVVYFPLNESSGATGAGNASATMQPALGIGTAGTVTDSMLEFGGGTGPDNGDALKLTPTSNLVGKALRGTLTSPLGGAGITGMSVACCFRTAVTDNNTRVMAGADDGKPTDGGAIGIFDLSINPVTPRLRAHIKFGSGAVDINVDYGVNFADDRNHMAVATTELSAGVITTKLYIDGVLVGSSAPGGLTATEFPELARWNVGCGASDAIGGLWNGALSHAAGWNRVLSAGEVTTLYTAASTSFSGELSGARATRVAGWAGMTTTAFDAGQQALEGHRVDEVSLLENLKLIARSEGGQFFLSSAGYATIHDRARRVNSVSGWSISAADLDKGFRWAHSDQLLANDVTVKRTHSDARVVDTVSQDTDGYGELAVEIDTIVDTDASALALASAYLARFAQPVSRPEAVPIGLLGRPELYASLLGAEVSDKFTITSLPAQAPASSVDLFVEGVGLDINPDDWIVTLDVSPASFDFGLILDDAVRGLLDTNYVGW